MRMWQQWRRFISKLAQVFSCFNENLKTRREMGGWEKRRLRQWHMSRGSRWFNLDVACGIKNTEWSGIVILFLRLLRSPPPFEIRWASKTNMFNKRISIRYSFTVASSYILKGFFLKPIPCQLIPFSDHETWNQFSPFYLFYNKLKRPVSYSFENYYVYDLHLLVLLQVVCS